MPLRDTPCSGICSPCPVLCASRHLPVARAALVSAARLLEPCGLSSRIADPRAGSQYDDSVGTSGKRFGRRFGERNRVELPVLLRSPALRISIQNRPHRLLEAVVVKVPVRFRGYLLATSRPGIPRRWLIEA